MRVKPLGDRIVIKPKASEEKSTGGIVIPDTAKERPHEGNIVSVGPGRLLETGTLQPLEVKVGQTVLYSKYAGTEIKLNGEEYVIVKEDEILAIVQ